MVINFSPGCLLMSDALRAFADATIFAHLITRDVA